MLLSAFNPMICEQQEEQQQEEQQQQRQWPYNPALAQGKNKSKDRNSAMEFR